ncbi:MAG: hypothetical protein A4E71_00476 [Smithella sp. PtaU1.Bin162]|nr:MAG: hypothetical protein A4E71_00476 [Smithella sp. PtaU1.Bin162]
MKFPGIVSQLCNDELGAGRNFFAQFVVLNHLLRFSRFERGNNCSRKEISALMTDNAFNSGVFQSPVHLRYELQSMDRIQIKYRCRSSQVA